MSSTSATSTKQLVIGLVVFGGGLAAVWFGLRQYFQGVDESRASQGSARIEQGQPPRPASARPTPMAPPASADEAAQRLGQIADRIGTEFRDHERKVEFSLTRMDKLGWIDSTTLPNEKLLNERIRFADALTRDAGSFREWLEGFDAHVKALVEQKGLAPENATEIITRFREDMSPDARLKITKLKEDAGKEVAGVLAIVKEQWGKWTPAKGGTYEFQDAAAGAKVSEAMARLEATFAELNREMTELMRKEQERVDAEGRALREELRRRFGDKAVENSPHSRGEPAEVLPSGS
jgi:hypothetical protein